MENFLSLRLRGFRRNYNTQVIMLEDIWKNVDTGKFSDMFLTDLSKAFNFMVHDLLIAKLNAYGFEYNALLLINSYLSDRKQRTKIGDAYSSWPANILGVPHGSILGPLLFYNNINDMIEVTNSTMED